ncbi:hypothetical protein P7K49_033377 [Saguinus oedipus]|uniref:Uncharacterized protein n=1 Tax=Saguinus oedipus TaxID=9490 RepID=A0ABQ9TRQ5_SAGOE|nr:hypothetical protein P7K49_033377 [Saguinus oedipus]
MLGLRRKTQGKGAPVGTSSEATPRPVYPVPGPWAKSTRYAAAQLLAGQGGDFILPRKCEREAERWRWVGNMQINFRLGFPPAPQAPPPRAATRYFQELPAWSVARATPPSRTRATSPREAGAELAAEREVAASAPHSGVRLPIW